MAVVQVAAPVLHVAVLATPLAMDHPHLTDVPAALQVVIAVALAHVEAVVHHHVAVVALAHVEAVVHHHVAVVAHQTVHQDAPGLQNCLVVLLAQIRVAVVAQTVVRKIAATTVKMAVDPDVIVDATIVVMEVAVQLV